MIANSSPEARLCCLARSTTIPLPSRGLVNRVRDVVVVPGSAVRSPAGWRGQAPLQALLVDRQPLFLAALGNLLEAAPVGAVVRTAVRSDDALAMTESGVPIDVVFCELRAHPLSGIEFVRALARDGIDVPVILLGEPGDDAELAAGLEANAAGLFTKDAALEEFIAGVQAVVSGHRAIGSGLLSRFLQRANEHPHGQQRAASQLSPTEMEILLMIGKAQSIPAIAASRGISHKTVRNHLAKIYRKLELHGRAEAVLWAARMGLTEA